MAKKFKHHHIYIRYNTSGVITAYRVLFKHDGYVMDKSFSAKRYVDPLKAAIEFRDDRLICKRIGSTTGVIGVYRVSTNLGSGIGSDYIGYRFSWSDPNFEGKSKSCSRSFLYRSGIITPDKELHAFRCASRFGHVVSWHKINGYMKEIQHSISNDVYPNLVLWKDCSPEDLFLQYADEKNE